MAGPVRSRHPSSPAPPSVSRWPPRVPTSRGVCCRPAKIEQCWFTVQNFFLSPVVRVCLRGGGWLRLSLFKFDFMFEVRVQVRARLEFGFDAMACSEKEHTPFAPFLKRTFSKFPVAFSKFPVAFGVFRGTFLGKGHTGKCSPKRDLRFGVLKTWRFLVFRTDYCSPPKPGPKTSYTRMKTSIHIGWGVE